ncbi:hypothetical protein Ctob_010496 [Chrysochromulina tobinii]|uniref:Uncharacterized protein n=1 Tax=Chrysochromulina tobinii TaxID=1460289 RepID=A0A0M0JWA5_9EUKA|nr:hypothetical protein Ctob_010496 [Chrysochromulina tobinii]|eukprot:KOO30577.1 hypothetical protein Ctob_010496 [Chrysochromulina sp. CCMP291]
MQGARGEILTVESDRGRHYRVPLISTHEVCFADDVDVDEAQLQTCFGSSQDIFGATETGYLLFYEAVDRGSSGDPPTSG